MYIYKDVFIYIYICIYAYIIIIKDLKVQPKATLLVSQDLHQGPRQAQLHQLTLEIQIQILHVT
jgi:hypothetical protein